MLCARDHGADMAAVADRHGTPTTQEMLAGSAFACAFSSSDDYESQLIALRRAEGRYATRLPWMPVTIAIIASALAGYLSL
jgi:hypothetical protein